MSTNIFEQASRLRLRFDTPKGALSAEDLWDLPLTATAGKANLDDIARGLNRELKASVDELSFVTPPPVKTDTTKALSFEIVKHIIAVRVKERDDAQHAAEARDKKQRLLELIDRKKNLELEGKTVEELQALVNAL